MYSTAFWYLFVVLLVFLALLRNHCYSFHRTKWRLVTWICRRGPGPVATRMPFFFFCRNTNPLRTFQLQPKRKTSSSSLEDQLEKRSIISLQIEPFVPDFETRLAFVQCLWPLSRLPTNLNYDNWHLHDRCQGGNDTSTRLLLCENRVLAPVV